MTNLELLLSLLDYRVELALWVLLSVLIYGLSVNVVHRLRRAPSSRLGRYWATFEDWPHSLWLIHGLRFLYYLCVPYLALTRGVTSPLLMGMWGVHRFQAQWGAQMAVGVALALGALLLLLWSWRHSQLTTNEAEPSRPATPYAFQRKVIAVPWGWGLIALDILYLEMHWAFYRGATIRSLGSYFGVFAGLLLVLAEWGLNPAMREDIGLAKRDGEAITTVVIALSISIIYYFTTNLWLCIAIHLMLQFGLLSFLAISRVLADHQRERN
jgi:hypothetical protein